MNLDELYFGACRIGFDSNEIETFNIFDSLAVRHSIAMWFVYPELHKDRDLISWIFIHYKGKIEEEFEVKSLFSKQEGIKTDVYDMYIEPNREYLTSLINKVSIADCKAFLVKQRNRYIRNVS